jgi:hypothetical protein
MADAVAEEPAVKLEFQNFGSSGEGVLDGRIGRGATPAAKPFTAPSAAPSSDSFNFVDTAKLLGGTDFRECSAPASPPLSRSSCGCRVRGWLQGDAGAIRHA